MAGGKSPIAGSWDPTRRDAVDAAVGKNTIFNLIFKHRDRRLLDPGRGTTNSIDPWTTELGEVDRLTKMLRGTPSSEGERADTKHHTDSFPASRKPPAGTKPSPTLYTSLDPWIPQPPAARAAVGGGGIHGPAASEVGRRGGFKKSPLVTVEEERRRPRILCSYLVLKTDHLTYVSYTILLVSNHV